MSGVQAQHSGCSITKCILSDSPDNARLVLPFQVMMSLKALGNTGHAESVAPTLARCFQNEENPMPVRVAAVNAFRRMSCNAVSFLIVFWTGNFSWPFQSLPMLSLVGFLCCSRRSC